LAAILWAPVPGLIASGIALGAMLGSGRTYWKVMLACLGIAALPLLAIGMFTVAIPLSRTNARLGGVVALSGFVLMVFALFVAMRCWMAGPAILADGRGVVDAFCRSLNVTRTNEGQTILFLLALGFAVSFVTFVPNELVSAWLRSQDKSEITDWWGRYSHAALFPFAYYTSLATWLGSIMWYEYLESQHLARTDQA